MFVCRECGAKSEVPFRDHPCCSTECFAAFSLRCEEERLKKRMEAVVNRRRLEAQAERAHRTNRSFRALYPV